MLHITPSSISRHASLAIFTPVRMRITSSKRGSLQGYIEYIHRFVGLVSYHTRDIFHGRYGDWRYRLAYGICWVVFVFVRVFVVCVCVLLWWSIFWDVDISKSLDY